MWSLRFMHPPPPFCLSICHIFVLLLRGRGARGKSSTPQRRGGGLLGHSINEDTIHAMTQRKWRFLGMFYAHMSIRLGLWQGGELRQRRRACGERLARMLLCVLFGLSSMCYWNRMLSVNGSCIFLLCFRGSRWTIAGKSGLISLFFSCWN